MEQPQKNTLSALGGMPVRDAMGGLSTGNREGKPARREQTIYTPIVLRDMLLALGDGVIALDPCSGPDSVIGALESWEGTRYQKLLALWYWGPRAEKFRAVFRASGLGEIA